MRTDIENLKPGDLIHLYCDGRFVASQTVTALSGVLETVDYLWVGEGEFIDNGWVFELAVTKEVSSDFLKEKEQDYGDAATSFERIASYWSEHLGARLSDYLTAQDVALMMILLKVSRTKTSPDKEDNWDDIVGYATLGKELWNA